MCVSTEMMCTRVGGGFRAAPGSRLQCGIEKSHSWQQINPILSLKRYRWMAAIVSVTFYSRVLRLC